jgi:hypothetical protein
VTGWQRAIDELAERERLAVASARWDEVVALHGERQRLIAALPQPLPRSARPVLERALETSLATERALVAALAETKGTLERLRGGRRAVVAYGGRRAAALDARA